jgi:hypothetical protein
MNASASAPASPGRCNVASPGKCLGAYSGRTFEFEHSVAFRTAEIDGWNSARDADLEQEQKQVGSALGPSHLVSSSRLLSSTHLSAAQLSSSHVVSCHLISSSWSFSPIATDSHLFERDLRVLPCRLYPTERRMVPANFKPLPVSLEVVTLAGSLVRDTFKHTLCFLDARNQSINLSPI